MAWSPVCVNISRRLYACNGFTNSIPSSLGQLESVERAPAATGEIKSEMEQTISQGYLGQDSLPHVANRL
jgi:hypothetical protein